MKKSLLALGLLSLTTLANAQHSSGEIVISPSQPSFPEGFPSFPTEAPSAVPSSPASSSSEATAEQKATAAWALYNVAGDALDLANDYRDNPGIGNTTAGVYLTDLANDTKPLRAAAAKLANLLEDKGPQKDIEAQLKIITARYADVRNGNQKASTQLYVQGFANEGYQIRTAYTKVRSRWVYLQGLLD